MYVHTCILLYIYASQRHHHQTTKLNHLIVWHIFQERLDGHLTRCFFRYLFCIFGFNLHRTLLLTFGCRLLWLFLGGFVGSIITFKLSFSIIVWSFPVGKNLWNGKCTNISNYLFTISTDSIGENKNQTFRTPFEVVFAISIELSRLELEKLPFLSTLTTSVSHLAVSRSLSGFSL